MTLLRSLLVLAFALSPLAAAERPNILWLTSEDHGPHLGCYGDPLARTPHLDALAAKGMIFKRAWSNAPVCAPARTAIISGMFPPSLGAEHMRSEVAMPAGARMLPQYLREAGYYCTNNAKEDYNLTKPGQVWDESSAQAHWRKRPAGAPFFAVFNAGQSHEGQVYRRPHQAVLDPAAVRVPAYHPDTPEVRRDWAQYHDNVSTVDAIAGGHLRELAAAGLAEDTIVFYYGDHGPGLPRNKRWPGDSGLRVPLVVHFPPKWRHLAPKEYAPGARSDRLVSFVDLAPTVLSLAGIAPPAAMQGRAFAGRHQVDGPAYLHGFRGRMDERYDLVRSVTDGRYVYLRNYWPHVSQGQRVRTQFQMPTTQVWRRLYDEGRTNDAQSIFWREPKAPEELYDLHTDPDEVRNLAAAPEHRAVLERLRGEARAHAARIRDLGFLPEAEIHARAGRAAPRDVLGTEAAYPLARVLAAAETASGSDPGAVPQLQAYLKDGDAGVRYWGVMGALMRGPAATRAMREGLVAALEDPAANVRIAAAQALARHGDAADLPRALDTLRACADPTRTSAFAGIAAMNVIDELGERARPLLDFVRAMEVRDPRTPSRNNDYVQRLKGIVLERFGEEPATPARKKRN
jgi:uncharacterized sulfatase